MTNYFEKALHQLGGVPVGNADDMHRFARVLRGRADDFRALAHEHRSVMSSAGLYEGSLATRMKSRGETTASEIEHQIADHVRELADYVDREANRLAHDQASVKQAATGLAHKLEQAENAVKHKLGG
jgi:uncharacterized protein YukE